MTFLIYDCFHKSAKVSVIILTYQPTVNRFVLYHNWHDKVIKNMGFYNCNYTFLFTALNESYLISLILIKVHSFFFSFVVHFWTY